MYIYIYLAVICQRYGNNNNDKNNDNEDFVEKPAETARWNINLQSFERFRYEDEVEIVYRNNVDDAVCAYPSTICGVQHLPLCSL